VAALNRLQPAATAAATGKESVAAWRTTLSPYVEARNAISSTPIAMSSTAIAPTVCPRLRCTMPGVLAGETIGVGPFSFDPPNRHVSEK